MKTSLLFLFLFLGNFIVKAQEIHAGLDLPVAKPRISIEEESRQMQRTLLLNEAQFLKVKEINKVRRENLDALEAMYPHEPDKRDEKMLELEHQFDKEYSAVFTPRQLEEYLELHGRGKNAPPPKAKVQNQPSFNSQIQAIIVKALTPVVDSSQLAIQNNLMQKSLNTDSTIIFPTLLNDTSKTSEVSNQQAATNDSTQITLIVKDLETAPLISKEKEVPILSDEIFWDLNQAQPGNAIIKKDPDKEVLKVATPEGELKLQDSEEKTITKDGLKSATEEDKDNKNKETSDQELKINEDYLATDKLDIK